MLGRYPRRSTRRSGRDPTGRAGPGSTGPPQQEDEERVAAARSRTAERVRRAPCAQPLAHELPDVQRVHGWEDVAGSRNRGGSRAAGPRQAAGQADRRVVQPVGVVDARQDRPGLAPGVHLCERSQPGGCRPAGRQQLRGDREAVPQAAVVPTRAAHHVAGDEGIGGQPVQQDTHGTVGTRVRYRPGSTDRGLDVSGSAGGPPATRTRAARSAAAPAAGSASWRRPPRRSGPPRAVR